MKFTLLEIVQEILSSMDSDEVNSVSDTTEAAQVAMIVRRVYLDLCNRLNLNEHFDFFQLTASGDASLPIIMYRPSSVDQVLWIKYDKRLGVSDAVDFEDIKYMDVSSFMNRMYMHNTSESNVSSTTLTIGSDDITLIYKTDRQPSYWTSHDDNTIIFDSYYSTLDTTLQKSKTQCYGLIERNFDIYDDDFTPDLDGQHFSLLINEAKALAWAELKMITHVKSERESKRQWTRVHRNKQALPSGEAYSNYNKLPDYGRK